MASLINPNDIDGAYPVAGQDNNSQGFRDNFTNTKTNFGYAADEITDLQNNVVLKAALTGTTLDNDMGGSSISDAVIRDFAATRVAIPSPASGSQTINYASGHYQTLTTGGSVTLAFTNFPTSGNQAWIIVRITVASVAHTLTLPAAVGFSASASSVLGIQGISSNVITFNETGTYEFQFHTEDGGTSIYLSELTRPRNRFVNPLFLTGSEDLAASGTASTTLTTSYFSTAAAETATLAAGTDGQVKVFAMAADSGDMVITVTNAGWKASGTGTITFDTIGDACTLLYTNSKWYVIGNNGVTFA
jgi:hypothetical protein